jgi:hypothetical protein
MARIGSSPQTDSNSTPQLAAMSEELWQPMLTGMQEYARNYSAAMTALNGEWMSFINRRLQEDFALPQRLASCKAPDEAMQIYTSFVQKAVSDYQTGFAELAKLGSAATTGANTPEKQVDEMRMHKTRQAS